MQQTNNFRNKLLRDYTLFELSDPTVLSYYINKMDFFISNFMFFKDIDLVTEFLIGNELFCKKFNLDAFIGILNAKNIYLKEGKSSLEQSFLTQNTFSTICLFYKKVILHYFKRSLSKKIFNKALNTILCKLKQIKVEDEDGFLSYEILSGLSAFLILMNMKKVNLQIFFNGSRINIKLLREITKILEEKEDYNCSSFNKDLIRNRNVLINEYIKLSLENDSIELLENNLIEDKLRNIKFSVDIQNKRQTMCEIYELLNFCYDNINIKYQNIKIKNCRLKKLDLYSQYYLAIYSREIDIKEIDVKYVSYLVDLTLRNFNNSFLLHSVFKIIGKLSFAQLFDIQIEAEHFETFKIHKVLFSNTSKITDFSQNSFISFVYFYLQRKLKEKFAMHVITEQIHAFMAKFYSKNKKDYDKYYDELDMNAKEYSGFDRFIASKIFEKVPVSSIFLDKKLEQ
ncbi:hypothetical protein EHP00_1382 [Ecytonucleospora hepatopenaei]|uniref:Uncharacterized protein n=1 Tax=Ecytonucleospora hepatopenaei TaxID=646526 RepID=A0A1W0E8U3_9MICR|nr:hypothetical protein EHP00_1382 [Ecytonucleospora hepatopenaei]